MAIFRVVQPNQNGPERWTTAQDISRHRSIEAAYAAIDKAVKALHRAEGQRSSSSYYDWHVVDENDLPVPRYSDDRPPRS